jgi:curved DNA-binding protein CbpA
VSDEKPKAGPPAAPAGGPPKLERVPTGYAPPPSVRPPPASAPPPRQAPGASYGLAAREVGADAAIAAGLAHQGALANESALRLFALAAAMQGTGRLTISPEGKAYALSFRRGTVEHVASTDPEDDLGRFLVRRGALSEDQRVRAESAKAGVGGELAAALISERLVNPADVAPLLQEHGAALVQRALHAEGGGWSWKPDAPPPPGAFPLGASFAMLCAAVRALDATALLRRLGDREHRAAARVGGRIRIEDLRLTPQEARAAQLFDGVRSPAELSSASPGDTLAVLRLALLLGETDLLAFGASRKGAAPPPPRPAASPPAAASPPTAAPPPTAAAARPPAPAAARPAVPRPATPRAVAPPAPATPRPAAAKPAVTPVPGPALTPVPGLALDRASLEALVKRLAEADHFDVLGLKRDAAGPAIKAAYFALAKTYHPDAIPADAPPDVRKLCADVFGKVSEAWSVLGEDASRAAYLEALRSGGAAQVDVMNIFQAENAFQAGTLLVKARKYGEAVQKFDEALRLNADEPEFAMWRAWADFLLADDKKRKLPQSAGAIEAALKRNPRCAQGYLFLGQMAKVVGDLALAEKQLKRGLQVAPDHGDMQRELKYLRK